MKQGATRIFFVRALDNRSLVFTQTKRLNFLFKVLFRDIRIATA